MASFTTTPVFDYSWILSLPSFAQAFLYLRHIRILGNWSSPMHVSLLPNISPFPWLLQNYVESIPSMLPFLPHRAGWRSHFIHLLCLTARRDRSCCQKSWNWGFGPQGNTQLERSVCRIHWQWNSLVLADLGFQPGCSCVCHIVTFSN